ncbi:MAG: T9SS type A sorting domain-containing protein [Chloroherpetonaceae bacterium]|nr:T9SS type A sorting domain-containing protein [Chloroherpetonaceae bacterium]
MKKMLTLLVVLFFTAIRLNAQDGTRDFSFNPKTLSGTTIIPSAQLQGRDVAIQTDGKIIVLTNSNGLFRLNSNGAVDSTFGTNGYSSILLGSNPELWAIAIQSDGKIVVAGKANSFGTDDFVIARFNANGGADLSFSGDGVAMFGIATGAQDVAYGLAIQPDGKIVAVGTTSANGTDWGMIRVNTDGTLDGTFTNGQITQTASNDGLYAVTLQSDGKIVVAGYVVESSEQRAALGRFNSNGVRDSTFDADGTRIDDYGIGSQNFNSVKIQADGKIIAAGAFSSGATATAIVGRYNTNGTNDNSFDNDGRVTISAISTRQAFTKLELQIDGNIVCSGYAGANLDKDDFFVIRLQPSGAFDNTFNTNGRVLTDFNANTDQARGLAIDGTGKLVVAGLVDDFVGNVNVGVARYNSNGTLDNSFAIQTTGSTNIRDAGAGSEIIRDLAQQSNGKIIAVGSLFGNLDWCVTRYNQDGSTDTTFITSGNSNVYFSFANGVSESATCVVVQSDDKILVGGYTQVSGTNRFALARFNANGGLDNSFAGGQGYIISTLASSEIYDVLALPNGKIIVAGWNDDTQDDFEVFQYNSDGSPDLGFGSAGQVSIDIVGTSRQVAYALARQADGKILVGGTTNTAGGQFAIARINADGTLDNTFDTDGKVTIDIVSANTNNESIYAIQLQTDGKIVVGGTVASTTSGIHNNFALARLNSNGSLDNTFGTNGTVVTDFNTREDGCLDIKVLSDGKILAAGYAVTGTTNDSREIAVARYLSTGALDNTFGTNGKVQIDAGGFQREDLGYSLLVQSNGRIIVGGYSRRVDQDLTLLALNGTTSPLSTRIEGKSRVNNFELQQNYPNPFNPSTSIRFQLPQSGLVQLEVFDLLGRKVATLINARQESGSYEVNFNASQLSSGVYFYRLQAGSFTKTMKMMLVK